jgi:cytochrome c biogenesis protein CcdA
MFRLIGLCVSIGFADSLNPSTIAPALYLATGERARGRVTEFTLAVFGVYFIGGAAIVLGPGQLLLSLLPHPHRPVRYIIEIIAGVAMLIAAVLLWAHRDRLAAREPPDFDPRGRSGLLMGATISAIELPTAFPYFAVIAAIVGSEVGVATQLFLLLLFNVCFVAPLGAIVATLAFGGDHAERMLAAGRSFLQRHWPVLLAGLALLAGIIVVLLGVTGLTSRGHNGFGHLMRRLRHIIHP